MFPYESSCTFQGFIRTEPFDLKSWMIPGVDCGYDVVEKEKISTSRKVYTLGSRAIKSKRVADVVEALIGAFLSAAGEKAALSFMVWLGMEIDFETVSYTRSFVKNPEIHVNVEYLESLLKYTFRDTSLLVEALTHGSYMRPEIPGCYQVLLLKYLFIFMLICMCFHRASTLTNIVAIDEWFDLFRDWNFSGMQCSII